MYKIMKHDFHKLKIVNETGEECYGLFNRWEYEQLIKIVTLLNTKQELLNPIIQVCEKYHIPLKDLPGVLDEYIVRDNDGYQGYSMCTDCRNDCNDQVSDCPEYTSKF